MTTLTPQQLVDALLEAGQTQLSIQEATGIPQATISRIRAGISKDPRSSTVDKLRALARDVIGDATGEAATDAA